MLNAGFLTSATLANYIKHIYSVGVQSPYDKSGIENRSRKTIKTLHTFNFQLNAGFLTSATLANYMCIYDCPKTDPNPC